MASEPTSSDHRAGCLSRLELIGGALGAGTGLIAAAPLLWLAAEAHRVGDLSMISAGRFHPRELLVMWAGGALVGGALAALLTRTLVRLQDLHRLHWAQHLLHLFAASVIIIIVAPTAPAALLAVLRSPDGFLPLYLIAGALVGWQSGVIALVFLYTFRMLERIRAQGVRGN